MAGQQFNLAAASSHHQTGRDDPRNQLNSTLNIRSVQPEQRVYGTPYNDGQVVHQGTNMVITPAAQQQLILPVPGRLPNGGNPAIPGHPQQVFTREQLEQLSNPAATTNIAMSGSQQRPPGDGRAALDRGLFAPIETRPQTKASGFNTRSIGAMRPFGA